MFDYIMKTYLGVKVTLAVEGLPIVITGEVMGSTTNGIINIKPEHGPEIHLNANEIVLIF